MLPALTTHTSLEENGPTICTAATALIALGCILAAYTALFARLWQQHLASQSVVHAILLN